MWATCVSITLLSECTNQLNVEAAYVCTAQYPLAPLVVFQEDIRATGFFRS